MNSSTLANKGLALAQKPKYYYNEHQRKITLCFVLLMILLICFNYLIWFFQGESMFERTIYIIFSILFCSLLFPFGGLLVHEFEISNKKRSKIKDFRLIKRGRGFVLEEVKFNVHKVQKSSEKIKNDFIESENQLKSQKRKKTPFLFELADYDRSTSDIENLVKPSSRPGPKEFSKKIFTAIKYGLIHHFDRKKCREDFADDKSSFFNKIGVRENFNVGSFKNDYNKFCNESSNLNAYFEQKSRRNYIDFLLNDSDIILYPNIVEFLNEIKERINSN